MSYKKQGINPSKISGICWSLAGIHIRDRSLKLLSLGAMQSQRVPKPQTRVRASQSVLTKGFEKKHHVFIIHCSPFPFLWQATLESGFLID
ncbi:hypothetical protein, partial [Tychonema sp. LEGE 07203]|uniref:hypothetical protein n=1 Tax=Tychonema sp. LEGE 07203 TaxID=1828671 RepID=UPI001D14E9D2